MGRVIVIVIVMQYKSEDLDDDIKRAVVQEESENPVC
jgi:hypothetical protein